MNKLERYKESVFIEIQQSDFCPLPPLIIERSNSIWRWKRKNNCHIIIEENIEGPRSGYLQETSGSSSALQITLISTKLSL